MVRPGLPVMTKHVLVTLTDKQHRCVSFLRGKMGSSDAEVLRTVFLAWLAEKAMINCWEMELAPAEFIKQQEHSLESSGKTSEKA